MNEKIKFCIMIMVFMLFFLMVVNFDIVYAEGETTTAPTTTTTTPTTTTVQTGTATPEDSKTTTTTTTTTAKPMTTTTTQTVEEVELPSMIDPLKEPDKYKSKTNFNEQPTARAFVSKILKIIRNFGVIISIVILTIIGAKYMLAGGAEEKAQYKESLIPMVVGVVMLVGSVVLISAIAQVVG